jgi:DNA-binding NtrC family response regulator
MRILIVDDEAPLRQSLTLLLAESGYQIEAEGNPVHALARAIAEPFDLILCDVRMPELDGLSFLRQYRAGGGEALMVMMSAYGGEDAALEAMREGAYDYLSKPFRPDEVTLTVQKAEERERLRREVMTLRASLGAEQAKDLLVAESRAMRNVVELAGRVAAHATTVLLTGESGTGKEVLARAIHQLSPRRDAAFTAINCAAIPEQLLESELFGHLKGSFTGATADRAGLFEASHGGTLLLDEIGDMPTSLQAKLLRVLEDGEIRRLGAREGRKVDVRLLAAPATPLDRAVERGEFREDLYYRLNVVELHLPPLRERPEDITALITHFARQAAQRLGRPVSITPRALVALAGHSWPGNIRELRNAIERAAVLSADGRLDSADFALGNGRPGINGAAGNGNGNGNGAGNGYQPQGYELKPQVEQLERLTIERALEASNGNRRDASRLLGVSLRTLFYKLRRYQLE